MTTETERGYVPRDTLANRLVLIRRELGLTHRQAEALTGVGRGAWQSWESGRAPRDAVHQLRRVAEALNIDVAWLMFGGALRPEEESAPKSRRAASISADIGAPAPTGRPRKAEILRLRRRLPLRPPPIEPLMRLAAA